MPTCLAPTPLAPALVDSLTAGGALSSTNTSTRCLGSTLSMVTLFRVNFLPKHLSKLSLGRNSSAQLFFRKNRAPRFNPPDKCGKISTVSKITLWPPGKIRTTFLVKLDALTFTLSDASPTLTSHGKVFKLSLLAKEALITASQGIKFPESIRAFHRYVRVGLITILIFNSIELEFKLFNELLATKLQTFSHSLFTHGVFSPCAATVGTSQLGTSPLPTR